MNRFKAGLYNLALMVLMTIGLVVFWFLAYREDPIVPRYMFWPIAALFAPVGYWFFRKAQEAEYGKDDEEGQE